MSIELGDLQQDEIQIGKFKFVVKEVPFADIAELLNSDDVNLGIEIVKLAVYHDGKPLGEDVNKLGAGTVLKLAKEANRLNGLSSDDEKKD